MNLQQDVNDIKQEVSELSFAMEMVNFLKEQTEKTNKRLVSIIHMLLVAGFLTIAFITGGFLYYIINYTYETSTVTSQEVSGIETVENSNIVNGGDLNGENQANN